MIETNILDWSELGEKLETLEIYKTKNTLFVFRFFSYLRKFDNFGLTFHMITRILFFLQILCLNSLFIKKEDFLTDIFTIIKPYILFIININDKQSYILGFILQCVLLFLIVFNSALVFCQVRNSKILSNVPLIFLNIVNRIIKEILIGPIIWIFLFSIKCENGSHIFLQEGCFSSSIHITYLAVSIVILLSYLALVYLITIFTSDCGSIKDIRVLSSLNSDYEIISIVVKISIFIFAFFVRNYTKSSVDEANDSNTKLIHVLFCLYVSVITKLTSYYTYHFVLFYNEHINKLILYGWFFTSWYSFIILFKTFLKLNEVVVMFLCGIVLIVWLVKYFEEKRVEKLIMECNATINTKKSLKEIELFRINLLNLLNLKTTEEKTILLGITRLFKENLSKDEDLDSKFQNLLQNEHLQLKYQNRKALEILAQIFILYHIHLEKSNLKNQILINLCYFLINNMKNFTYVSYLISRSKAESFKDKYNKFILIEEIKEYMLNKQSKTTKYRSQDNIKNVQLSSVILLEYYCNLLKTKINESIFQRVEYFELLTSRVGAGNTHTTLKDFITTGDKIMTIGREIQKISSVIREINPFEEEIFHHYNFYLEAINKDYKLAIEEKKKLNEIRLNKMPERGQIYFSLFDNNSNIILVDGFNNKAGIIYASKNFFTNFNTNPNDILSKTVHDLVPTAIKDFHEEIMENGIKYSNLSIVFNKQRILLLRNSRGILQPVKIYIKSVPNLKHGLIYNTSVIKIDDQAGIIVLNSDMVIDGLTDFFSSETIEYYLHNRKMREEDKKTEKHIAMMIPEIIYHMRFNPKTGKFFFVNQSSEFKGTICTMERIDVVSNLLKEVLEILKQNANSYEENLENFKKSDKKNSHLSHTNLNSFNDMLNTFVSSVKECSKRQYKVFYRINTKNFVNNKYHYHKIILNKDLSSNSDEMNVNDKNKTNFTFSSIENEKGKNNNEIQNEIKLNKANIHLINSEKIDFNKNRKENFQQIQEEFQNFENVENIKKFSNKINTSNELKNKNSGSISTRHSTSSSEMVSLSTLKNLLVKKEISIFRTMRLIVLLFFSASLLFLFFFYDTNSYKKYNLLNSNKIQAKFFNNSKLIVSQIYYTALNIKMLMKNFYQDDSCLNKNCKDYYSYHIDNSISLLKDLNSNSTFFQKQFREILFKTQFVQIEIFNRISQDSESEVKRKIEKFQINYKNMIDIIISYSLKIKNFMIENFSDSETDEMAIENIINHSYSYITDKENVISPDTIIDQEISKEFSQRFSILVAIKICFVVFLLGIFLYFGYSIYSIEKVHLTNLINFKNPLFLEYQKFLSEEWKKITQSYEAEMQKLEGDEFESNAVDSGNNKLNKNGDESAKIGKDKNLLKNESLIFKNGSGISTKKNLKDKTKQKIKKKKINENQNKINSIRSFVAKFHCILLLKIMATILIASSYIIIISIIDKQKISEMQQLDQKSDELFDILIKSNYIYFNVKSKIAIVIDKELEKMELIKNYDGKSPIKFDGKVYNSREEFEKSYFYDINFPGSEATNVKAGNLFNFLSVPEENSELSKLYFGNSCDVLYTNKAADSTSEYNSLFITLKSYCENFWFGVLTKGFEQSMTKLNSIYTGIAEDLKHVKLNAEKLSSLFDSNSNFHFFSNFMEIFFYDAFVKTNELLDVLKSEIPYVIDSLYAKIVVIYVILMVVFSILLVYIINTAKNLFNSLMNFIYIIPAEYMSGDTIMLRDILTLEKIF